MLIDAVTLAQATARTGTYEHNGLPIHYIESGAVRTDDATDQDAPTVVFIHGYTLAGKSFVLNMKHIWDQHPEVPILAPDYRGHGETPRVAPNECTTDAAADDVAAVIQGRASTGRLILVGHSLGGSVALDLLRRYPEIRERTVGLVLVATAMKPFGSKGIPRLLNLNLVNKLHDAAEKAPKPIQRVRRQLTGLMAPILAGFVFHRKTSDSEIVRFHARMINTTPLASLVGFMHDLAKHSEVAAAPAIKDIPGSVITGDSDTFCPPAHSKFIKEHWPAGEYHEYEDVGHMVILEAPEYVDQAIDRLLKRVGF